MSATLSRNICVMGLVRSFLSPKEVVYNTLVLRYLSYCAMVWGGYISGRLNKLVKLQKGALRFIDNKSHLFLTIELLVKHDIRKWPELIIHRSVIVLLAFFNSTLTLSLASLFCINGPFITRAHQHCSVPFSRSNYRTFSFSFTAPERRGI